MQYCIISIPVSVDPSIVYRQFHAECEPASYIGKGSVYYPSSPSRGCSRYPQGILIFESPRDLPLRCFHRAFAADSKCVATKGLLRVDVHIPNAVVVLDLHIVTARVPRPLGGAFLRTLVCITRSGAYISLIIFMSL